MKKIILVLVALCLGFFALVSSIIIAISLTIVGFVLSKTQKKTQCTSDIVDAEYSNVIEGECTDVTRP